MMRVPAETAELSDSLVFECDFAEPPQKVWRALTEPRLLEAWLTPEEPAAADGGEGGRVGASEWRLVTAEPLQRLRYHWRERASEGDAPGRRELHSVVTIELTTGPAGGTHLRLTHGEFKVVAAAATLMSLRGRPPLRGTRGARRRRAATPAFAAACPWRRAA